MNERMLSPRKPRGKEIGTVGAIKNLEIYQLKVAMIEPCDRVEAVLSRYTDTDEGDGMAG